MNIRLHLLFALLLIGSGLSAQSLNLSNTWAEDCNNNCDAFSVISAGAGTPPYQYSTDYGVTWQTNDTIFNLCRGTHSVWVQDALLTLDSIFVEVYPLSIFNLDSATVIDGSGGGACDGVITLHVSGGFPPYEYRLNGGAWQSSPTFNGVCPGMHNVEFRDSTGGDCSGGGGGGGGGVGGACDTLAYSYSNISGEIYRGCFGNGSSAGNGTVGVGDGGLSVTTFGGNEECGCDALVSAIVTGGLPPYQFNFNGSGFSSSSFYTFGCSPSTNLVVMDALGNTITTNIPVGWIPVWVVVMGTTDVSCTGACDGSVTLDHGNHYISIDQGATWQLSPFTYSGLCPGSYDVWAVLNPMSYNCVIQDYFDILEPAPLTLVTASSTDATCFGSCDGTILASASGGTPPYTFDIGASSNTTGNFLSVCPGSYTLTVTDVNGCTVNGGNFIITEPGPMFITTTGIDPLCAGDPTGQIDITASAGAGPPFMYSIDGGATFQGSNTFVNVLAGNYVIAVMDANGCVEFDNIILTDPPALTATVFDNPTSCPGICDGSISATASGGTPPYSYDWGVFGTGNIITNLCIGSYDLTITDANGCTFMQTINLTSGSGSGVTMSYSTVDVSCNGMCDGEIIITASGGTAPYTYNAGTNFNATGFFNNLCPGSYNLTVTDANGCGVPGGPAIITEPAPMVLVTIPSNPTCNASSDGTIDIVATGGTPPYQYSIDNGITFSGSNIFTGLPAGNYDIVVLDNNGCAGVDLAVLTDPAPMSLVLKTDSVSCFGACDGIIATTVIGGAMPYSYDWNGLSTNDSLLNVCAGTWSLTVTDANGCSVTDSATLFEPAPLTLSGTITHTSNNGVCDGGLSVSATGGNGQYTFSIDTGLTWQSSGIFTGLCPDSLIVMVTDAKGCTTSDTVFIGIGGSVWPGDANFDGIANNLDYLYIGFGYNDTGAPRATPSINWQAWPATDWNLFFQTSVNHKHADCEGTGTINADDTTAIVTNYNLTHSAPPPLVNNSIFSDPTFTLVPHDDTVSVNDTLHVDILLGDAGTIIDSIYGTAFSIGYDTSIVEAGSAWITYGPGWFGTPGTDMITLSYDDWNNSRIDGAITRIDHQNTSGQGWIGTLHVVMPDDISGKKALIYDTLNLYLNRISAYDALENKLELQEDSVMVLIKQIVESQAEYQRSLPALKVYPNPANEQVTVELPCSGQYIELLDISGRLIRSVGTNGVDNIQLDINQLRGGLYQVRYHCREGIYTGRFIKK